MDIISRKEAIDKGLNAYFTGKPCKNGHLSERSVKLHRCLACGRIYSENYREKYPAKVKESLTRYNRKNAEKIRSLQREFNAKNSDKRRELNKAYREKHPNYFKKYYEANKSLFVAHGKARKLLQTQRVPSWANLETIKLIYAESERISKESGVRHEVDHIIPLRGKNVCGLHVETNLRIITAEENRAKGCKLMEDC